MSKKRLLEGAIWCNILITTCPFVDYYANWYITLIPILVMLFCIAQYNQILTRTVRVLFTITAIVCFMRYLIHGSMPFVTYLINGIIAWTPCIITIICATMLEPKVQKRILQVGAIAMMITAITTVQGLIAFPFAARELAGEATEVIRNKYMLMNIGGFEFIYALVIGLPVMFWLIKNTSGVMKYVNITVLLSSIYCIYMSAYTTALIISALVILLMVINLKPNLKPAIIIGGVLFVSLAASGFLSNIFLYASQMVESDYVADRLMQVSLLLQGQSASDIDTKTSNERLVLMQNAWNGFFSSPILGNNWVTWHKDVLSGHSFVLDILSSSGILGFAIYISLFYFIFKICIDHPFKSLIYQSRIVWIAFIAVTIMNPTTFAMIYLVIFVYSSIINNLSCSNSLYNGINKFK